MGISLSDITPEGSNMPRKTEDKLEMMSLSLSLFLSLMHKLQHYFEEECVMKWSLCCYFTLPQPILFAPYFYT